MSEYVWRDSHDEARAALPILGCAACRHCLGGGCRENVLEWDKSAAICSLFDWDWDWGTSGPDVTEQAAIAILEMATEDTDE